MEILLYTTVTYFLCGFMDLFLGTSWNGAFWCANDPFDHWDSRNKNRMDFLDLPES